MVVHRWTAAVVSITVASLVGGVAFTVAGRRSVTRLWRTVCRQITVTCKCETPTMSQFCNSRGCVNVEPSYMHATSGKACGGVDAIQRVLPSQLQNCCHCFNPLQSFYNTISNLLISSNSYL